MKKILIMGSLLAAIAIIAISISQWNTKVDTTTEKAKKEIDIIAEKNPSSVGKTPSSNATNEQEETDSKNESSASGGGTDSQTNTTDSANTETHQPTDTAKSNEDTSADSINDSVPTVPSTTGKTLTEIKAAYRTVFSDLEVQETSRVDQLIVQAKADYISGKLSKTDLLIKYQDASVALERNSDQVFNALYSQLQIDLEKTSHDPNEANQFKSEYQVKKQQRLSRVISQLQNF